MAMTADSAQGPQTHNHTHPASSVAVSGGADGVNSPPKKKTIPWAQVVRSEPDAVNDFTTPSSPERQKSDDAPSPPPLPVATAVEASPEGKPKPAAWKRPSPTNGSTESVMGAMSWPALSESTKASSKSDSFPVALPESSEGSVTPHPPGPGRSNLVQKNTTTARQRSMKKGGSGSSDSSAGVHLQKKKSNPPSPPPPPTFPGYHMHTNGPAMLDAVEPPYRPRTVGGFVPQLPAVNDYRHFSRRGNLGPRGDGPYQNNRREHDRPHYGNARDNSMQRGSLRGYVRPPPPPPPSAATYVHPQPMRPFNPTAYPEFVYVPALPMEPYRGVPFIAPLMHPPFGIPVPELPLSAKLVHQIDYYFSDANLVKDEFLKSNMDNQGWVPITLIAGFKRVKSMTNNIQVILESLRTSTVVEIQDDKVRRRNDWMNWIPGSGRPQTDSSPPSSTVSSGHDPLTTSIQSMSLENAAANQNTAAAEPSSLSSDASGSCSSETVSLQGAAEGTASSLSLVVMATPN